MTPQQPLSAPVNVRDLGGIRVSGGRVRSAVVLRADDLSLVREQDADRLVAAGLTSVIDLRTTAEVHHTGRGVLAGRRVSYHHLSLMTGLGDRGEGAGVDPRDPVAMGGLYAAIYRAAAGRLVTSLAIIATSPGTTAFHCAAGKDRTGVLAAALLLALGADDSLIVEDYAITGTNAAAIRERLRPVLAPVLAQSGVRGSVVAAAQDSHFTPVPMEVMLTSLREQHGDPLVPLRAAGLSDALLSLLHARAVEVGP